MTTLASLRTTLERDGFALIRPRVPVQGAPALAALRSCLDASASEPTRAAAGALTGYFPLASERAVGSVGADDKEFLQARELGDLPTGLRDAVAPALESALSTAQLVADALGLAGLGVDVDYRAAGSGVLRLVRYGQRGGAASHTDMTLFTLLLAETAPAVTVTANDGRLEALSLGSGMVAVLAGDMLEIATGGTIRACRHRVEAFAGRCSVLFFANPDPHTRLQPGLTAGDALERRLAEIRN